MKINSIAHNAIVLGSHTTALYVVRCLGRCGAKVAVIDTHHHGEARFSRYCNDFVKIERFSPDELRAAIDEISRKLGACAIFPSNDEAAKALSQSMDSLPQEHVAIVAPWETTLKAYDKRLTYELALASDIPMPKTFYPEAGSDIYAISRECQYPVLVKPTTTAEFRSTFGTKAIGAADSAELTKRFEKIIDRIEPAGLLIQEFVPGTNRHFWHYGAVFNRREPLVEYVISRKRQYPIDFGTASHAEIRSKPAVAELGARILAAMDFVGPAEVQFKYDKRNDTYQLLDVNPRFWKSCGIAELLNVNMALLAYKLFVGESVQRVTADTEEKLIWFDMLPDIGVATADIIAGRVSLRQVCESYKGRRVEATFARDDWLPGIVLFVLAPYLFIKGAG